MTTKVSDVSEIVKQGINSPQSIWNQVKEMAASEDWKIREVAATVCVEVSKKKKEEVVQELLSWVKSSDPNTRRCASEGLRDVIRKDPSIVTPVIEGLNTDDNLYVKKSVANLLRNASRKNPDYVIELCKKWEKINNDNTKWIIKEGMKKLNKK